MSKPLMDLKNHAAFQAILNYVKSERLLFYSMQSPVSYEEDSAQGIFAKQGYSSEDVDGYWMPSLKEYFSMNYKNFQEFYAEFGFFSALEILQFSTPWKSWTWVVSSLEHEYDSLALTKARAKHKSQTLKEHVAKEKVQLTHEEVLKNLNQNMVQISPAIWVAPNDPTVIVYDPKHKPYALPQGWSGEQIGEILSEWLEVMTQEKITPQEVLPISE